MGGGRADAQAIRDSVRDVLATEPLASVDYVSLADDATLAELERVAGPAMLSLAVRFGTTRLIDNVRLRLMRRNRPVPRCVTDADGAPSRRHPPILG